MNIHNIYTLLLILLLCILPLQNNIYMVSAHDQEVLYDCPADAETSPKILFHSCESMELEIQVGNIFITSVDSKTDSYDRISVPGWGSTNDEGLPALPVYRTYIALPTDAAPFVSYEAISKREYCDIMPLPFQMPQPEIEQTPEFYIDTSYYNSGDTYPGHITNVSDIIYIAGVPCVWLEVFPFSFDTSTETLSVIDSLTVNLTFNDGEKTLLPSNPPSLLEATVINYQELESELCAQIEKNEGEYPAMPPQDTLSSKYNHTDTFDDKKASYLIITADDYYDSCVPLAEWRQDTGYYVDIVRMSDIGEDATPDMIQEYVRDAFFSWDVPPEYLLLMGDTDTIPCYYGLFHYAYFEYYGIMVQNASDTFYGIMDDSTYLPSVYVGRIPATSPQGASYAVEKILSYECNPYMEDTSWFKSAAIWQSNARDIWTQTCNTVKQCLYSHGFLVDHFVEVDLRQNIMPLIEEGRSIYLYRAHGNFLGQAGLVSTYDDDFLYTDVPDLENGKRYTLFFSPTCESGIYDIIDYYYTHYGEYRGLGECLIMPDDLSEQKGAIAFYGASRISYSYINDVMTEQFFETLYDNDIITIGAASTVSLYRLCNIYGPHIYDFGEYQDYFLQLTAEIYNLLGDPAVPIWTDVPQALDVDFSSRTQVNETYYVNVRENDGTYVKDAIVCLDGKTTHLVSRTDINGNVSFKIPPMEQGEILRLTVMSQNHIPFSEDVAVIDSLYGPSAAMAAQACQMIARVEMMYETFVASGIDAKDTILDTVQVHMEHAASLANPIYACGELSKAIELISQCR